MRAKVLLIISALLMIGAFADTTTVPPTSCQETKSRGWYWDGQKCERCVSTTIQPRFAVCTDANASTVILCYADEIQDTDKDGQQYCKKRDACPTGCSECCFEALGTMDSARCTACKTDYVLVGSFCMKHQYETKSALFADDDDKSGGNGDENFNDKWRTAGNSGAADCESYDNNTSDYLAACEKYDVQSVRCIGCPAGSYLNHCQQCVQCTITNCKQCRTKDYCEVCNSGTFWNHDDKICQTCLTKPSTSNGVTTYIPQNDDTFKDSNNVVYDGKRCSQCTTQYSCDTCENGSYFRQFFDNGNLNPTKNMCASCVSYVGETSKFKAKCEACTGYYWKVDTPVADPEKGTCLACYDTTKYCKSCKDNQGTKECTECNDGYYLNDQKKTCVAYPSTCKTFKGSICVECFDGYFLQDSIGGEKPKCVVCEDNRDFEADAETSTNKPDFITQNFACLSCSKSDQGKNCNLCNTNLNSITVVQTYYQQGTPVFTCRADSCLVIDKQCSTCTITYPKDSTGKIGNSIGYVNVCTKCATSYFLYDKGTGTTCDKCYADAGNNAADKLKAVSKKDSGEYKCAYNTKSGRLSPYECVGFDHKQSTNMNDADTTPIDKYRDDKYFPYVPPFGDDASKPADLKNLYHLIYDPIANDYICALNPGTCKYLKIVDTTSKVADDNVDCDQCYATYKVTYTVTGAYKGYSVDVPYKTKLEKRTDKDPITTCRTCSEIMGETQGSETCNDCTVTTKTDDKFDYTPTVCNKCLDGYFFDSTAKACKSCDQSKSQVANAKFYKCTADAWTEFYCDDNYILNGGKCLSAITNCVTYDFSTPDSPKCTQCKATFRVKTDKSGCESCTVTNCDVCDTDIAKCDTCSTNYALYWKMTDATTAGNDNTQCVKCAANCATCNPKNPNDCASCVDSTYLLTTASGIANKFCKKKNDHCYSWDATGKCNDFGCSYGSEREDDGTCTRCISRSTGQGQCPLPSDTCQKVRFTG